MALYFVVFKCIIVNDWLPNINGGSILYIRTAYLSLGCRFILKR